MERKIGEIFEFGGEWYQCLVENDYYRCKDDCVFYNKEYDLCDEESPECIDYKRSDNTNVIFKKLEKVGEPYAEGNSIVSERMFQKYRTYEKNFFLNERDLLFTSYGDIVSIEIKQNQEDMEEKYSELTDIVHEYMDKDMTYKDFKEAINDWVDDYVANKESDKPTLKPFDLQQAKDGKPVCTRDGRKARIICFDAKDDRSIIALVESEIERKEIIVFYLDNGFYFNNEESQDDLMMLPEKKEGWVNIYNDGGTYYSKYIYKTEKEATGQADTISPNHVTTVKINWEE